MVSRKYTSDYRLEDTLDPKTGRMATRSVYQGQWFRFCAGAAAVKRTAWIYTLLTALCALGFVLPLLFDPPAMRAAYVAVPFVALVFSLFYLAAGCRRVFTAKDRVTREHRDKIVERLRGASVSACALSGVSLVGVIVYWCMRGFAAADLTCACASALLLSVNLIMLLRLHGRLAMEPVEQQEATS